MFHILRNHQTPPKRLHRFIFPSAIWKFWELHIHITLTVRVVQSLSHVWLFVTPWTAAHQASLFFIISWNLPKFMSIASVVPSNHLIFWYPLLLLPSIIPSIRNFPMSQLFASDNQNTGVSDSASVLPMKIQVWFPLGLTGLISLQSGRLSSLL